MKKNILVLSENKGKYKKLEENFNLFFSEDKTDKIDVILVSEGEIVKLNNIKNKKSPVLLSIENLTELDEIKKKHNYRVDDYLLKSYKDLEILKKIQNTITLNQLKKEREKLKMEELKLIKEIQRLNIENKKLFLKNKEMEDDVNIDPISNLYSRKYIIKHLAQELDRSQRTKRPFAVAIIKIKGMNEINDNYGKLISPSKVVNKISNILSESVRGSDLAGRVINNTFLIILPEIIEEYALTVIRRIVDRLEMVQFNSQRLYPTAGFFIMNEKRLENVKTTKDIFSILEKLMYFSEQSKKNIVEYKEENIENIKKLKEVVPINELEEKHNLIWEELNKSQKFIEKLLPKKSEWEEKLNYSYLYYPFNFIGGDFFDFIEIDKNRTAILFCDVSGHGVSSALYITAIKYIFKNLIKKERAIDPEIFLDRFNKSIIEISEGNIFVATTYGYVDRKEKEFVYGFGGGTSPIKIDVKERKLEFLAEEGFVIGLMEESYFETKKVKMGSDDILLFYSDGIYEFLIEQGIITSEKEFYEIVEDNIEEDEEQLLGNIYSIMQSKTNTKIDFDDDITMLALKCNGNCK
ncbi:MAG: hypothetical protein B6I28_01325 [Fusobacteriia bacterium 4572_132]|nr:MAG: hypothetical protein B6I28_01325 [Fusobacteriia bacterium 4572_132]